MCRKLKNWFFFTFLGLTIILFGSSYHDGVGNESLPGRCTWIVTFHGGNVRFSFLGRHESRSTEVRLLAAIFSQGREEIHGG